MTQLIYHTLPSLANQTQWHPNLPGFHLKFHLAFELWSLPACTVVISGLLERLVAGTIGSLERSPE